MRKDNYIQRDNGSVPASPLTWVSEETATGKTNEVYFGLTKREQFASMAMQGLLSNPAPQIVGINSKTGFAEHAVKQADALLAELAKDGDQ